MIDAWVPAAEAAAAAHAAGKTLAESLDAAAGRGRAARKRPRTWSPPRAARRGSASARSATSIPVPLRP